MLSPWTEEVTLVLAQRPGELNYATAKTTQRMLNQPSIFAVHEKYIRLKSCMGSKIYGGSFSIC